MFVCFVSVCVFYRCFCILPLLLRFAFVRLRCNVDCNVIVDWCVSHSYFCILHLLVCWFVVVLVYFVVAFCIFLFFVALHVICNLTLFVGALLLFFARCSLFRVAFHCFAFVFYI